VIARGTSLVGDQTLGAMRLQVTLTLGSLQM
jgi:hypothetical protein